MIGFNGGLIGAGRTISPAETKGVWTTGEQIQAIRNGLWPKVLTGDLLVDFPGASVAYSLRLLTPTYTGNLVTVRRSSDNTTAGFTEAQINGSGAGSLTSFCSGTNGFVTTWHDQSGNGNNATQSTQADQPQIVTSGTVNLLNSKPCLTYSNSGNTNLNLATRLTNIISVFEVLNIDSAQLSANGTLLGDSSNFDYAATNTTWLDPTNASALVRNGSNRLNNVITNLTTATRTTGQVLISMIHIGNATASKLTQDRTNTTRSVRGNMQEVILYNSSQSIFVPLISSNINTHYSIY
jgi:hypothetical protein